jgi:predicted N-acetyltransferase YhbS
MAAPITIRRATPADASICGPICFEAFRAINARHGFPDDIPNVEHATGLLSTIFSHPGFYSVIAESDARILGSNCLDERSTIAGIGPITIDPSSQNSGVGRGLMHAVLERSVERGFPGVRLVQAAFHNRSLSLYAKLGFDAKEPLSLMEGPPPRMDLAGRTIRRVASDDLDVCNRLCQSIHGAARAGELSDAVNQGTAILVEIAGRVTGYATVIGFFGHAVAESNLDLQALISSAGEFRGPGILVPTRNARLFRWCLENGLRVRQPMTLMALGLYNEPMGAYLPSILY